MMGMMNENMYPEYYQSKSLSTENKSATNDFPIKDVKPDLQLLERSDC